MISGVTGPPGSGKTALAAYLAYKDYLKRQSILSNTMLNFPFNWVTRKDLVERLSVLKQSTILLSEIHAFGADSRKFSSKQNIDSSYLFTQTRKRDLHIVWDSQFKNQVDLRLRQVTDWEYQVTRQNRYEKYYLSDGVSLNPNFCPWAYVEVHEVATDIILKKFWFNIVKCFPLYDTYQIIDPMKEIT